MKNTIFYKSLKNINSDFILIMLLDLISIFIFLIIAGGYYYFYGYISDRAVFSLNAAYIISYVFLTIIALFLITLNSAYFKYLIYEININQKSSFNAHLKFSLFWVIPWSIFFILLLAKGTNPFIIVFFGLIYVFLTTIARNQIRDVKFHKFHNVQSQKYFFEETMKKMFEIVFSVHKLLIHYFIMLVFLFFIMMITGLVSEINKTLFYFLFVAVILFYMSWARSYLDGVIREVKR